MIEKYLIINKKVLPDYFEKVVDAKNLVEHGFDVSSAVKKVGISRSTYYKYKDYVFTPNEDTTRGKRAIISLLLSPKIYVSFLFNWMFNAPAVEAIV